MLSYEVFSFYVLLMFAKILLRIFTAILMRNIGQQFLGSVSTGNSSLIQSIVRMIDLFLKILNEGLVAC